MARHGGSAARRWYDDPPEREEPPPAETIDPAQLALDLLDEDIRLLRQDFAFARAMLEAMVSHEPIAVRALLANAVALRLPRAVREEAQLFSSLSRSSLRAPMQALQHHRRLAHLLAHRLGASVETVLGQAAGGR